MQTDTLSAAPTHNGTIFLSPFHNLFCSCPEAKRGAKHGKSMESLWSQGRICLDETSQLSSRSGPPLHSHRQYRSVVSQGAIARVGAEGSTECCVGGLYAARARCAHCDAEPSPQQLRWRDVLATVQSTPVDFQGPNRISLHRWVLAHQFLKVEEPAFLISFIIPYQSL